MKKKHEKMTFWKRTRDIGNFKNYQKILCQDLDLTTNDGISWIFILDDRTRRNRGNRLTLLFWGGLV